MKKAQRARKFTPSPAHVEGLDLRTAAVKAISLVLHDRMFLDEALQRTLAPVSDPRDRAFAHVLAATALRRKGQIEAILANYIDQKLRARTGIAPIILLCGMTQILFMETESHAAISTSVEMAARDERAQRLKGLINAVLRKVTLEREAILADLPPEQHNLPKWLHTRLRADYGPETAAAIAHAHSFQAPLDLSLKIAPASAQLRETGTELPTGTVRLTSPHAAIPDLPGFREGDWWVQDAAAALPVKLFGNLKGKRALDMCCAPGGKTMQMCAAGAQVTAIDNSETRLARVLENLARTDLSAHCQCIDAAEFETDQLFDVILLDAPCTATGTIRRHPDMPYIRSDEAVKELLTVQRKLLRKAAEFLAPGGVLVYAVCSLLADEGHKQISAFLREHQEFSRMPLDSQADGLPPEFITKTGDLRTLPHFQPGAAGGMDGFFAARLIKAAI